MGLLSQITTGKIKKPLFVVGYGPPGVGKSSFAAEFPKTIFMGNEDGTNSMEVSRFPKANSLQDIQTAISELLNEQHDFQTLALDALDGIEQLVNKYVCDMDGSKIIDDACKGYGKGHVMAASVWLGVINSLVQLREKKNMNIVAIAHSHVKPFNDPSLPQAYDRYSLKLNERAAALWREHCDCLLFMNYETFLKASNDAKKTRAHGDGARVMFTERRPAFDAKNRLGLPFEMALSYAEFASAVENGKPDSLENVLKDILELTAQLKDEKTKEAVPATVAKAGQDVTALSKIRNRLRTVLNQ